MPIMDEKELNQTISELARLYRKAVDKGDEALADHNLKAVELLAEGRASLAKAIVMTAFVSDSDM